jgi:hypothetical protein
MVDRLSVVKLAWNKTEWKKSARNKPAPLQNGAGETMVTTLHGKNYWVAAIAIHSSNCNRDRDRQLAF